MMIPKQQIDKEQKNMGRRIKSFLLLKVHMLFIILFLLPIILLVEPQAGEWDERRVSVGFKLFPALLAADKNIKKNREQMANYSS